MRKFIFIVMLILLMSSLLSCDSDDNLPIYGEYNFDKVLYLSSLSSVSMECFSMLQEDARYHIDKNSFQVELENDTYEIDNPSYVTMTLNKDQVKMFNESVFDGISLEDYKYKYQFDIFDSEGNKSNYRLYLMDSEVWLASYITANKKEYIFDICRLR